MIAIIAQGSRDNIADALRGLAIILVVVGHVIIWLHRSGITFSHDLVIKDYVYSFHMPLMFMISGYVHGIIDRWHDPRGYLYHVKKSTVSIYLPYLWVSYFGWAVSLLIFRGNTNPINYNMAGFSEFFKIPYIGFREYWFLCTLFQVKLIHTAFEHFFRSVIPNTLFWVIVFLFMNCGGNHIMLYIYRLQFGMYFHIGYLLKVYGLISREKFPKLQYGIMLFTIGFMLYAVPSYYGFSNKLAKIGASVCASLSLFSIFYALNACPALLVLAGSTSMVMFIVHDYVIFLLALVFKFTGLFSEIPIAASLLTFSLAVGMSLLIVQIYRNVKCLRWIEYIFYPGRAILTK